MTAGAFDIRYAVPADVDDILDLFEEVAAELLWIGPEPGFDRERRRVVFLDDMRHPDETPIWVARDRGDALAGSLSIFGHRDAGLAIGMLVRASYRRRGIGQALIDRSFEWAGAHGVAALSLHVFPHNHAARALYEKAGFTEIARFERTVTRQTGEVYDSILMRKKFP